MKSYEDTAREMLDMVPADVDKREGSLIHFAVTPIAAMTTEAQVYADNIMDTTMPDTAAGDDLTRRCASHGVNRYPASAAIRLGIFTDSSEQPTDVPIGSRFGADDLSYVAVEKLSTGRFRLRCEQPGITGNRYFGAVLPLDNLRLGTATLADVITPGEDEETDEELRTRFYITVNARPFGGNIPQYEEEVRKIAGVGDVKVFPTPNNEGGHVHIVIVAPGHKPVSTAFLQEVEDTLDPVPKSKGMGIAPIDHYVTVSTVDERSISVSARLYLQQGFELNAVLPGIRQVLEEYLAGLAFVDNVVRLARVEAAILGVGGVADIFNTALDGSAANVTLATRFDLYEVPVLGELQIGEA